MIADIIIGPAPPGSTNEGDAFRTVEQIDKLAATKYIVGYKVLNYGAVTPTFITTAATDTVSFRRNFSKNISKILIELHLSYDRSN